MKRLIASTSFLGALLLVLCALPRISFAANFSLVPSNATFEVGETFDVSVLLDTDGKEVNAIELGLEFPPDKLQVISPNTGRSIIEIWAGQPKFNNKTGLIEMRGGIPGGVNIENGLITTMRFRVKASGSSFLQFTPESKILANDGQGTDILVRTPGAIFNSTLPRPAGPLVDSETHPDQNRWYPNSDVVLTWGGESDVEGFSYILNDEALFKPDTISEGLGKTISYRQLGSGTFFFHIRSLRDGVWGGTTHYQVNIDKTPPAEFKIEVLPSSRTSNPQPVIKFFTTDGQSSLDHYEMKVVSLKPNPEASVGEGAELFNDVQSPYILFPLESGSHDIIIRAYDKAYNYREVVQRVTITSALLSIFQTNGIQITPSFLLTWTWIWIITSLILAFFALAAWRLKHWPRKLGHHDRDQAEMPSMIKRQLDELKAYQKKYGKLAAVLLFVALLGLAPTLTIAQAPTGFRTNAILTPPTITTISRDLTTADTFYIGGETVTPNTVVVVYWNNVTTGETLSATIASDDRREWFYHHPTSLAIGNYVLWAQSRVGETVSPPSPQFDMVVRPDALKIGPANVTYEVAYLTIISFLVFLLITIGILIIRHWRLVKIQHQKFMEELRQGEESIRRGFAVLRRDLELEFAAIKQARTKGGLSKEELTREQQIVSDLEEIRDKIGKEIWDLEKFENER